MANQNFDPGARYDSGPNCAGAGRSTWPANTTAPTGLQPDGTVGNSTIWQGYNFAGAPRNNVGCNTAGEPRSINNN